MEVIRYEMVEAGAWADMKSVSANIVPIVHKNRGKGEKPAKGLVRIYGSGDEYEFINTVAREVVKRLNNARLAPDFFGGAKSCKAKNIAKELGIASVK